jgi:hypothetical protein
MANEKENCCIYSILNAYAKSLILKLNGEVTYYEYFY